MSERIPFPVIKRKVQRLFRECNIDISKIDVSRKKHVAIDLQKITKCRNITMQPHPFSNDISGVFYKKGEKLFLGVNNTHTETRQRFTVAHEIGHHILHADDVLHFDITEKPDALHFRADKIQSPQETEANFFAAELLMPAELIKKCVESGIVYVSELAKYFKVSEEAMSYRLVNLGYL